MSQVAHSTATDPQVNPSSVAPGAHPLHLGAREVQITRALRRLRSIPTPLDKYTFLDALKRRNEEVFYGLVGGNMRELCPLIYTPTIGEACQKFSLIQPPPLTTALPDAQIPVRALYLSAPDVERIPEIIKNLTTRVPKEQMEICVVSDGSRILGLGDLGVGGMGICQGKLALYTAAGGVDPRAALPVVLDLGTNNEGLLNDPLYVGWRNRRLNDEKSLEFVRIFMKEMHANFPNMIIQFEDFRTSVAFPILEENRDIYPCFNDDIQGTGAVILAGAIRAFQQNQLPLRDQKILFFGAGSSGVGVAETICRYFVLQGIPEEQARAMFWLVDSKGLVAHNRGDELAVHKKYLAREDPSTPRLETLLDVVHHVKPTALMGLSTVGGTFTPEILAAMANYNKRPIVFPLSNPVAQAECTFEEAVEHTDGRVLFASGSPFDDLVYKEKKLEPGQGNNMYIFPGLGLGAILAKVSKIPEELIHASSQALANCLTDDEISRNLLYPDIERIRDVSVWVAMGVVREAQKLKVDRNEELRSMDDRALRRFIRDRMYHPLIASN